MKNRTTLSSPDNDVNDLLHHEVQLDFEVNAFFYPNESWYKPDVCNNLILSHEQLHFDITELHARKFRQMVSNTRFTNKIRSEMNLHYNTEEDSFEDD